jgi:alanine racemase
MQDLSSFRPTWAEINLTNLIHNYRVMKGCLGDGVGIMPALKANAYGHGAVECARALEAEGAEWFGVALPEEGILLRKCGIKTNILCLGGFWEGQEEALLEHRLTPVIFRLDLLERLDLAAKSSGVVFDYHLKVDTGMGRLGVPHAELRSFLDRAGHFENTRLDGVMTHLSSADVPAKREFTKTQMSLFEEALDTVRAAGHDPRWIHQANSAGAHAYPGAHGNLVRLGGVLYGLWRDVTDLSREPLAWRPVLALHTRIMFLKSVPSGTPLGYGGTFLTSRESRIATLAIGYEDGLSRALSNRGHVLVRERVAPIVGRVSMDLTLIDVTDIPGAAVGDRAVVIGADGPNQISVEQIAGTIGTLSYEVTCGISERVPRVFTKPEPT